MTKPQHTRTCFLQNSGTWNLGCWTHTEPRTIDRRNKRDSL